MNVIWVYVMSEPLTLWTTGFYSPDGEWHTDDDFNDKEEARKRVHYLNGGKDEAIEQAMVDLEHDVLSDEDQLLRIKIIGEEIDENGGMWYSKKVGEEFDVIDFRYELTYKAINLFTRERHGYIAKDCCEIIKVLIPRKVPDFPFFVKIINNSWSDSCWYKDRIGEIFEITTGSAAGSWITKHILVNRDGSIQKKDCIITNKDGEEI